MQINKYDVYPSYNMYYLDYFFHFSKISINKGKSGGLGIWDGYRGAGRLLVKKKIPIFTIVDPRGL